MTLLLLILIPAIGAAICAMLPRRGSIAKMWALAVSLLTALAGIVLALNFNWGTGAETTWSSAAFYLENINFGFKLGADSISIWLVLLTVVLEPLAILASFQSIRDRQKDYYAWMLALLSAMLGVFIARDLLLFYVFFELTLIPMFFIIGIWGGPDRRYAAGKFFLFTFAGSVFTLAGAIYLGLSNPAQVNGTGGFDLYSAIHFAQTSLSPQARFWLLLAFLAGFAVKVPLFPVHTWLPLAHTEAPTAGSVILAGVLLKLGTYGLLRIALPVGVMGASLHGVIYQGYLIPALAFGHFTITTAGLLGWIAALCIVGVIYAALVAWVQPDIKKLVAYSSVSHLGFCVLGMAALNVIGVSGSVLYMVNHGLSTGAMFLCIGMIYDRYHTRDINELSGLARIMPRLAFFFILFTLSSIGLPGLNGFVSEFLTILGAFTQKQFLGPAFGSVAALGIILGAVYMLHMAARIIWGPLKVPDVHGHGASDHGTRSAEASDAPGDSSDFSRPLPRDLNAREVGLLIPLALAVIILGVYPNVVLKTIARPVQQLVAGAVNDQGTELAKLPVARPAPAHSSKR
jgi:NADH-quinone oxidoreductase subunit M